MEISVIASSSIDGGIRSWDLITGKEQLRYHPCASPAHCLTAVGGKFLAASQSQSRNASASSGSIFYWSWTKPQVEVRSFPVESIKALTANSEGTYLVVGGGSSGDIYLWEVATGKLLKKWHGHYGCVTCLVFSGDDSLLVSGSQDGCVIVWSLIRLFDDSQRQPLHVHKFDEHKMPVTDIVIDHGGCNAIIVSASQDWTCKVWSLSKGKLLRNIGFPSIINSLALDPGGSVFYAGGNDSKIYIGAINANIEEHGTQVLGSVSQERKAVKCLAYCSEENLLISGSEDGMVCVWDPKSRLRVRDLGHGKHPVENIQLVIKANSNKAQSRRGSSSSLPPPLEKYERSSGEEDAMDGVVIVDPPLFCHARVYSSSFLSADLINEQVKELQQQGFAATEMEMKRLKHEYKRCLQMNDQWQKNYENLLQVVMEKELNGGSI